MSRAPEKFRYVFRYIYTLMGIVGVAALAVIVSFYYAQNADREAHDRVTYFNRAAVSLAEELRRENQSLLRLLGFDIPSVAEVAPSPEDFLRFGPDTRGTLRMIEAKLIELHELHSQHGVSEFAATLRRINNRYRAVEYSIGRGDPVDDTRRAILTFDLALEQLSRQHSIAAETTHPDVDSIIALMTPYLSIISLILLVTGSVSWVAMRLLHKSLARQGEVEEALTENLERVYHLERLESVGRLVGGIAHDFNNLLTAILGQAGLLQDRNPDERTRQGLAQIQEAGRQAAALTKQLLEFGRPVAVEVQVVDLNEVIANTESMLASIIGEDIDMRIDYAEDIYPISVDPGQMRQVLVNLVINARDAMPSGGALSIATKNVYIENTGDDVTTGPVGRCAKITVSDTGCGMTEDVRQRIFEPYFTTKQMGHGIGLGLATAYGIIKAAQGRIDVSSEPGTGTRFEILLPRSSEAESSPEKENVAAGDYSGKETILVVEDEQQIREFLKEGLESLGYRVLLAGNAAEGLEACGADTRRIDVILADVILPGMNGAQLLAEAHKLQPHAESILMSGYTDDVLERTRIEETDVPLVHKPFEISDIARVIRDRLAERSEQDSAALAS